MAELFNFLYSQLVASLPYPKQDWTGRTVIVTGANIGLGLEAARHFVRLGASKVILGCRSVDKGEAAKQDISTSEKLTKSDVVEVWPLDLTNYESVKVFGKKVSGLERLDVIVENAGIATETFRMAEGNEITITTNVISTFLLALLVLPKLKETASKYSTKPYLVIVSSDVHGWTQFKEKDAPNIFQTLNDEKTANMSERYPLSKLLEVLIIREWVSTAAPKDSYPIIINYVTPGLCHSSLTRERPGGIVDWLKFFFARSTEYGSRTLVSAASAGEESHGEYLRDCRITPPAPLVLSPEGKRAQERVWGELKGILEGIEPGVTGNL